MKNALAVTVEPFQFSSRQVGVAYELYGFDMDPQSIIENYGYAAILIGTFLEGETILELAGLAAHQGYLVLTRVILAAFVGSLCGDQLFFYFGRKHSQAVLSRRLFFRSCLGSFYRQGQAL